MNVGISLMSIPTEFIIMQDITTEFRQKTTRLLSSLTVPNLQTLKLTMVQKGFFAISKEDFSTEILIHCPILNWLAAKLATLQS